VKSAWSTPPSPRHDALRPTVVNVAGFAAREHTNTHTPAAPHPEGSAAAHRMTSRHSSATSVNDARLGPEDTRADASSEASVGSWDESAGVWPPARLRPFIFAAALAVFHAMRRSRRRDSTRFAQSLTLKRDEEPKALMQDTCTSDELVGFITPESPQANKADQRMDDAQERSGANPQWHRDQGLCASIPQSPRSIAAEQSPAQSTSPVQSRARSTPAEQSPVQSTMLHVGQADSENELCVAPDAQQGPMTASAAGAMGTTASEVQRSGASAQSWDTAEADNEVQTPRDPAAAQKENTGTWRTRTTLRSHIGAGNELRSIDNHFSPSNAFDGVQAHKPSPARGLVDLVA
jgi:hypothetical protein